MSVWASRSRRQDAHRYRRPPIFPSRKCVANNFVVRVGLIGSNVGDGDFLFMMLGIWSDLLLTICLGGIASRDTRRGAKPEKKGKDSYGALCLVL